jgi:hypothetical protein
MVWLRSNRYGGAWVALFALACQLLLSFGHVHIGKNVVDVWRTALNVSAARPIDLSPLGRKTPRVRRMISALFARTSIWPVL